MSEKKNNIFVRILHWLLEEWIKALLLAIATLVFGALLWIFRNYIQEWLTSFHTITLAGWAWILVSLLILGVPAFVFYLIKKRLGKVIYKEENDIKNILKSWFYSFSTTSSGRRKRRLTINFSLCDEYNRLEKGSSKKYLEIIAISFGYYIVSKGKATIRLEHTEQSRRYNFLSDLPEL